MASLTIRKLDDELKSLLRQQAARHGCSMAQEVRDILRRALSTPLGRTSFAVKINHRFSDLQTEHLPIPKRRAARVPLPPKN